MILCPSLILIAHLCAAGTGAETPPAAPRALTPADRIVFFGDSITRLAFCPDVPNANVPLGWATMLRADLDATLGGAPELINAGVGGDTVIDLAARVDADVVAQRPTVVTIMVGLNDTWRYARDPARNPENHSYVRPPAYRATLTAILAKVRGTGARVILCTPTLLGEAPSAFDDPKNVLNVRLNRYSDIARQLAVEQGVELLDLRAALIEHERATNVEGKPNGLLTLPDGVHLNPAGQRFIADRMLAQLMRHAGPTTRPAPGNP